MYRADWIGTVVDEEERPLVARAFRLGEIIEGEATVAALKERVRVLAIPVRCRGEVIGVLTRESAPSFGRQPGELERTYVDIFNRFARMIAAGDFPFDAQDAETEEAPRVGDGVILLDASGRVEYTSPNGVSALHRIGVHANTEGLRFGELGPRRQPRATRRSRSRAPVTEELEGQADVSVLIRCIPLIDHGAVSGAVVLTRDVSELRRRDRLLLSKDATIREIHHRVKNNLQTISSLLRLQGRRFSSPEAKVAIEESVRRIRAIALVHETLSREAGDDVAFVEIVRPLARMVEEGMSSEDRPVSFTVEGDAGFLPGHGGHAAVGGAQRAAAERHRPRLPAETSTSRPSRAGWWSTLEQRRRAACGPRWSTTASGSPRASRSTAPPASACRSCAPSSRRSWPARSRSSGAPATATGPGTVVRLDVPVAAPRVTRTRTARRRATAPCGGRGPRDRKRWRGGQAVRRWRATYCLRSWRRSSSEVPPHTPESWLVARAYSRHGAWASHWRHTALAFSICSMAGPVVPTGKNRSGSVSRHRATSRQSSRSMVSCRVRVERGPRGSSAAVSGSRASS